MASRGIYLFLVCSTASASQLVAHWSFDDGEGNKLTDSSGNAIHGTINGATWVQGIRGMALSFDGVNDRVTTVYNPLMNLQEYTVEAWVKTNVIHQYQSILSRQNSNGDLWDYRVLLTREEHYAADFDVPVAGVVMADLRKAWAYDFDWITLGNKVVANGEWRHIAVTMKNRRMSLFVDGKLDAIKTLSADPPSHTEPITMGATNFQGGYFFFKGAMDEVTVSGYAMDAFTIAQRYQQIAGHSVFEINLGMKAVYAQPGDTLWVPIYLTNFTDISISSCQFRLQFDPSVVTFLGAKADSGLAKDWFEPAANVDSPSSVSIALGGSKVPLNYSEGEFLRCKFLVKPDAKLGSYSPMTLAGIKVDENDSLHISTMPGKIILGKPSILHGDVTGDKAVSVFDASKVFQYVVGSLVLPDTSSPNFTTVVADVSGNGAVTSYDAALIYQYSVGLLSAFPVQHKNALTKNAVLARSHATLVAAAPIPVGDNLYRYQISGKNLESMISGEISMHVDPSIILDVQDLSTTVKGARLNARMDMEKSKYLVTLLTTDDLGEAESDFLTILALHKPGQTGNGIQLESAYLNEGAIIGNFESKGSDITVGTRSENLFLSWPGRISQKNLKIRNPESSPVSLQIFDLQGKSRMKVESQKTAINLSFQGMGLETGTYHCLMQMGGLTYRKTFLVTGW